MLSNNCKNKEEEERNANLWRLIRTNKKNYKAVLDDKYLVLRTIGDGRYAKVKLAVDLRTQKHVAIKILKMRKTFNKHSALECLFKEIKILSQCDHPHIAKIIEASFDGVILKEPFIIGSPKSQDESKLNEDLNEREHQIKRKTSICYYVMKLAEFGELFRFIEHTDKFSEKLARTLFLQLLKGLDYLHMHGIVHRDVKPENLLINSKFRIVIGDFGFAHKAYENNQFSSLVERSRLVGSEEYNPPELNCDSMVNNLTTMQEEQLKVEEEISTNKRTAQSVIQYDGVKADIFSAAATLFLMVMRCPPFRKAQIKDPFYKRLVAQDKKHFWNIFKGIPCSQEFKDLFEKTSKKEPDERLGLQEILSHRWFEGEKMTDEEVRHEILKRFEVVEKTGGLDLDSLNKPLQEIDSHQEQDMKDHEEFEQLRITLIDEIEAVNKKLKFKLDLKKIKREVMKNMIEGPPLKLSNLMMNDTDDLQQLNSSEKAKSIKDSNVKNSDPQEEKVNKQPNNSSGALQYKDRASSASRLHSFDEE